MGAETLHRAATHWQLCRSGLRRASQRPQSMVPPRRSASGPQGLCLLRWPEAGGGGSAVFDDSTAVEEVRCRQRTRRESGRWSPSWRRTSKARCPGVGRARCAARRGSASVRSRRRRKAVAAAMSAEISSTRPATRAVQASKVARATRAVSDVSSPVRTRRAIAEETSATAKSLTSRLGRWRRRNASARAVRASTVIRATSTLAST